MKRHADNIYSRITPDIKRMAEKTVDSDRIPEELYIQYDVKRGLRDINGKGVMAGLTNVSEVRAKKKVNGEDVPDDGHLFYRGYAIEDLIRGVQESKHYGFEEIAYLLLLGNLPNAKELEDFSEELCFFRSLPTNFVRDVIMKAPSKDMMNLLARSVLTLYPYDTKADDTSIPNVLRQSMQLISELPMMAIYGYQAYNHYECGKSLIIHHPLDSGSVAENILHLLRPNSKYTELEAKILDISLILHMDHGGGNNSAFTTHVVTSTMTDTYSTIAAALASLKGPRHGGANKKVLGMFEDLKKNVRDWKDEEEIGAYLDKLLNGEAFDHSGLIYGVGHAVYSKSDPRAVIFKKFVEQLADAKGMREEFELYSLVEATAPKIIAGERKMYKGVCANVDFYSGFAYRMLGLPQELFTPLFAMARIVGWSAHRLEELSNNGKIIRPAYQGITPERDYIYIGDRK